MDCRGLVGGGKGGRERDNFVHLSVLSFQLPVKLLGISMTRQFVTSGSCHTSRILVLCGALAGTEKCVSLTHMHHVMETAAFFMLAERLPDSKPPSHHMEELKRK